MILDINININRNELVKLIRNNYIYCNYNILKRYQFDDDICKTILSKMSTYIILNIIDEEIDNNKLNENVLKMLIKRIGLSNTKKYFKLTYKRNNNLNTKDNIVLRLLVNKFKNYYIYSKFLIEEKIICSEDQMFEELIQKLYENPSKIVYLIERKIIKYKSELYYKYIEKLIEFNNSYLLNKLLSLSLIQEDRNTFLRILNNIDYRQGYLIIKRNEIKLDEDEINILYSKISENQDFCCQLINNNEISEDNTHYKLIYERSIIT